VSVKTYMAKKGELPANWYLVDAEGQVLGRLASRIATILMGKHRPEYTPHVDTGEFVIVVNAEKVVLTGRKMAQKSYQRYSGYPGGRRVVTVERMLQKHPTKLVELAVVRMLPKTWLGTQMSRKLKVYAGPRHPHQAQQPKALKL
jgi:large subunit ribosomal protein L13